MITEKNIVLTGCNSGIGLEFLKLLVKGNNKILAVDKDDDILLNFPRENVTVMKIDISSYEAVDRVFEKAEEIFPFIDIFYANAGYGYYEAIDYRNWDRVKRIFETNVFSPIYSYQKYVNYLNGRKGIMAITVSAIGEIPVPGFTLYSSSKFALNGFNQVINYEKPDNLQLTCLYPMATATSFFRKASEFRFKLPFPIQQPEVVAEKMMRGIEKGKRTVHTLCGFGVVRVIMELIPPLKKAYFSMQKKKLDSYLYNLKNGTGKKWDE